MTIPPTPCTLTTFLVIRAPTRKSAPPVAHGGIDDRMGEKNMAAKK